MADVKYKYYTVNRSITVKAPNQSEAARVAQGRRGALGKILGETQETTRISSTEAYGQVAQTV